MMFLLPDYCLSSIEYYYFIKLKFNIHICIWANGYTERHVISIYLNLRNSHRFSRLNLIEQNKTLPHLRYYHPYCYLNLFSFPCLSFIVLKQTSATTTSTKRRTLYWVKVTMFSVKCVRCHRSVTSSNHNWRVQFRSPWRWRQRLG